jgi:hypothetical protein
LHGWRGGRSGRDDVCRRRSVGCDAPGERVQRGDADDRHGSKRGEREERARDSTAANGRSFGWRRSIRTERSIRATRGFRRFIEFSGFKRF